MHLISTMFHKLNDFHAPPDQRDLAGSKNKLTSTIITKKCLLR